MAYSCRRCGTISTQPLCPNHPQQPRTTGRQLQAARAQLAATQDFTCHICGEPILHGQPWHIDHIQPLAAGGHEHPANRAPAHAACNQAKGG